ncbi:MAG: DUF3179 domain-containing (seleno)protein [Candidatus Kariarchaeaceae archaeon]|jgi:hypothetical protein
MVYEYFIQLGIVFAWLAFVFRSNLLLYLSSWHITMRFATNAKYVFLTSIFLIAIGSVWEFLDHENLDNEADFLLPTGLYIFLLVVVNYGTTKGELKNQSDVINTYEKFVDEEPEMLIIRLQSHPDAIENASVHIIPMKFLRARDLILPIKNDDLGDANRHAPTRHYSLTYCLLCNSAHAYLLPLIDGIEVEISSQGATAVNGNKALADSRGKYVWQQFTGQGISQSAKKYPLIELSITRYLWTHVESTFPTAKYYDGSTQIFQYTLYKILGKIVRNISFIRFEVSQIDPRLGSKVPVAGVNLLGEGSKAYPLEIFPPGEFKVLEDKIGTTEFSLVYNGYDVVGFKEIGLSLVDRKLKKGEKSWSALGKSEGNYEDLTQISVTGHAYWYLWSKFYPNTEVYLFNKE